MKVVRDKASTTRVMLDLTGAAYNDSLMPREFCLH